MNGVRHMYTDFTSIEIYKKHFWYLWWLALHMGLSSCESINWCCALVGRQNSYQVILWSIIAVGLIPWLVLLFTYNPISHFWRRVDGTSTGKSLPSSVTILCTAALGLLPAFLVWKLQMNSRTKFTVEGIHGLGEIYVISWPTGHFGDESIANYKQ
ncbi:hypothetical protein N7536_005947 [Penicillium majusculum]|nr:hypothetical protein N7536_005947 [Penicillium majusculum]